MKPREWRRGLCLLLTASLFLCFALTPLTALGKEGVFINDSVYFTLDNVRYTEGADDSSLRFSLTLHNKGASVVDFNQYGVRVADSRGIQYPAVLSGKLKARVQPGQESVFPFSTEVAPGLTADQLFVTVFAWGQGSAVTRTIGSLSVASALSSGQESQPAASVHMASVDSTLPDQSWVTIRQLDQYFVYRNNKWQLYIEVSAENTGTSAFTLPQALKARVQNSNGVKSEAALIDGADQTLLPGKPVKLTLQAAVADDQADDAWALQWYVQSGEAATVLDSISLLGAAPTSVGESQTLRDSYGQPLSVLQVDSAKVTQAAGQQWVRTTVKISNTSDRIAALPDLTGYYYSSKGGVTIQAEDVSSDHPDYLSQGESETYSFSAVLPKGMSVEQLQLALMEAKSTEESAGAASSTGAVSTLLPVAVADLNQATVVNQTGGNGATYEIGEPMEIATNAEMSVALSELKLYDNETNGFQTAIAKLKITNVGEDVIAFPTLSAKLRDAAGQVYTGTRQASVAAQIDANSSYVVSYSFLLRSADDSKPVTLSLYEGSSDAALIASVNSNYQSDDTSNDNWDVYPYNIVVKSSDLVLNGTLSTNFAYSLKMNLDIERKDQVIMDSAVSKLQFDIVDPLGQLLGSQTVPFVGTTRLLNGDNHLTLSNISLYQYSINNYAKVYEVVDTPNGAVKRYLGDIR
ncbi:hypothetical protein [Paenibacillus turpanensis]|uniref:hypothetical protein n=1 Tax=Paenibacillus turpanensis TaxID=2689078 RepID=UPI00140D507B|nr:hypothetical protein [Paenibacillus turpanensis]